MGMAYVNCLDSLCISDKGTPFFVGLVNLVSPTK